jgi:hypothetical protein
VKPTDLLDLLQRFYQDKADLYRCHEESARHVQQYEFNNAYQYVIAREETQLSWLRAAIESLGAQVGEPGEAQPATGKRDDWKSVLQADARLMQEFVDSWKGPVEEVTNARHKGMMRVILGETLEHKRFFDQALAGRSDLLGRRPDGAGTPGVVLPTRWVE